MKFVLIVIWMLNGTSADSAAVAMHEFDTLDACENAGRVFTTMASKKSLITRTDWSCVEKALVAKK